MSNLRDAVVAAALIVFLGIPALWWWFMFIVAMLKHPPIP